MIIKGIGTSDVATPAMNEQEVVNFLQSKLNLQLATIDESGDPNIQPVWFDYEKDSEKLYVMTPKMSNKVRNIRNKPNVYFSIDDEKFPYKGVKGKGTVHSLLHCYCTLETSNYLLMDARLHHNYFSPHNPEIRIPQIRRMVSTGKMNTFYSSRHEN